VKGKHATESYYHKLDESLRGHFSVKPDNFIESQIGMFLRLIWATVAEYLETEPISKGKSFYTEIEGGRIDDFGKGI